MGVSIAGVSVATWTASSLLLAPGSVLSVGAQQVVSFRHTGWTIMTGTPLRSTFATGSITTAQLAGIVMALQQDLGTTAAGHGLIDA